MAFMISRLDILDFRILLINVFSRTSAAQAVLLVACMGYVFQDVTDQFIFTVKQLAVAAVNQWKSY